MLLVHWAPTWITCSVCKPEYQPQIIIKMENLGKLCILSKLLLTVKAWGRWGPPLPQTHKG